MKKFLIIGDSCLDEFVYCKSMRLAPDLPIPVLEIEKISSNPGMAMNVYRSVSHLSDSTEIITNTDWQQQKKTRYVDSKTNHAFIRVDSISPIDPLSNLPDLSTFEHIIISDYNKGFLTEQIITNILSGHKSVFLDTKKRLGSWAKNARYIKINDYEYKRSIEWLDKGLESKIIHTKGKDGCEFQGKDYPAEKVEVADTSGAGDAFMAALVTKFADCSDIVEAIEYANFMASSVVQQKGVTGL